MYTDNVGGSFSAPQEVARNVGSDAKPRLVIDQARNNTLHLVYEIVAVGIFYRQGTLSGSSVSWSSAQTITTEGSKTYSGGIAVDKDGNVHISWFDNSCGDYNIGYRERFADGVLGPVSRPKPDCVFQSDQRLTVTDDGKAHMAFRYKSSGSEIYYSRLDNGSWTSPQNISQSSGRNDYGPSITTDGSNIFVAWEEGISSSDHDVMFRASFDGGNSWSNIIRISDTPQFGNSPDIAYSKTSKRVYIAYSDGPAGAGLEIWFREFDPVSLLTSPAERLSNTPLISHAPSIETGPRRASIGWQDRNTTNTYQIFYVGGEINGDNCGGTISLESDATTTRNNPIPA